MNWQRYIESQGNWQNEVVLSFMEVDRADPFLAFRIDQYKKDGRTVTLISDEDQRKARAERKASKLKAVGE